ncbi:MAG: M18 family aminopeptidase [Selenomonas sp.]|uniref:M18 family aminopeptidase n=1 Tax=Selenomonas sp. TaxID=2053611 RepID=UPI0025EE7C2B|nr:M18 family aminopeptidase [Selenomonas sp.]MCR5758643.1 M18 family aminopeptidase [Selenomonas sp.]
MKKDLTELLRFIGESPTPYHTVMAAAKRLVKAGFAELDLSENWQLQPGGRYFVKVFDSTLLAFALGKGDGPLRIAAAHTDFPCFRLKPQPEIVKEGYGILNVEKYGGMMLRTWLDRPLGVAGKVALRTADPFRPKVQLVDFRRPLLTIPSLAIHMDREVNDEGKLNVQKDMLPLATMGGDDLSAEYFHAWLAEELHVAPSAILSYELSAYPCEEGTFCGLQEEFISSPRLDNLTSVVSCLAGIKSIDTEKLQGLRLAAFFDNEEVGSQTKQGAGSAVLMQVLERIYLAWGKSREKMLCDIAGGFMLSVDVAHALHPNFADKCDPSHKPVLGGGVVLKQAASQSYAGDTEAVAMVRGLCEAHDIPWQHFVNRSDSRGGSTLGSIASTLVPLRTMDVGVPLLAMHSARETMHGADQEALVKLLKEVFY